MINQRVVRVPGSRNFRDLGGYVTKDGRSVKWGRLFRSGHLAKLKRRGVRKLREMGLSVVVDFRSNSEVETRPDQEVPGAQQLHLPVMDEATREFSRAIRERIKNRDYEGFDPGPMMEDSYRAFADDYTPEFRTFLHTVLNADGAPVLTHCTSGKDRTGFASALLLKILGVDMDTIFEDYLLSNRFADKNLGRLMTLFLVRGWKAYRMVKPLIGVQEAWLRAAFAEVDNRWGSFDAYLVKGLELTPADVDRLQLILLD